MIVQRGRLCAQCAVIVHVVRRVRMTRMKRLLGPVRREGLCGQASLSFFLLGWYQRRAAGLDSVGRRTRVQYILSISTNHTVLWL